MNVCQKIFILMKEQLHLKVIILLPSVGNFFYSISEFENVHKLP